MVDERYAKLASLVYTVKELSSNGITIDELHRICVNGHRFATEVPNTERYPGSSDFIARLIEAIKSDFDKIESSEDAPIWNELNGIVKKYNLTSPEQLIQKVKDLRCVDEVINQLITNINTIYPNQVYDANSLVVFVSELVKQIAALNSIQQNSNMLFTNFDAVLSENAILKAQNEQYRQMLIQLGQDV